MGDVSKNTTHTYYRTLVLTIFVSLVTALNR